MAVITRKIQINPVGDKEYVKDCWDKIRNWNEQCFRAANYVATHFYFQEKTNEFFYLHDDFKIKLADREKVAEGIFNTSPQNTTYRLLSDKYKGEMPASIFNQLNSVVRQSLNAEKKDYFSGKKSLRSYKRDMPIPFGKNDLRNITKVDGWKGDYAFTFFGMNFRTWFGRDLSGNEVMFDRAVSGEYSFCDSSIQIKKGKMFLNAVLKLEYQKPILKADKELRAELGIENPIVFEHKNNTYTIGNKEEYLHRRLQIQQNRRNAQISSTFNKGGRGRAKKMQVTDHFIEAEKNYVTTRIHQYTAKLINWCIKLKCGTLVLVNQKEKEEIAKDEKNKLLLRNWSYFGMTEKLKYKCNLHGIKLVIE